MTLAVDVTLSDQTAIYPPQRRTPFLQKYEITHDGPGVDLSLLYLLKIPCAAIEF